MQRYNLFFNWPNLFSKIFLVCFLNFTPFLKAGAKLQLFFELPKLFWKKISSILMNLLPSRKRVQKYNNFSNWPNNLSNFFWRIFYSIDNQIITQKYSLCCQVEKCLSFITDKFYKNFNEIISAHIIKKDDEKRQVMDLKTFVK